jgi:hypothetical protein
MDNANEFQTEPNNNYAHMSINSKLGSERMIATIAIGILEGISTGVIGFAEAERSLFGPYGRNYIRNLGVSHELITLISRGLYLEDYDVLYPKNPQEFYKEINEIKEGLIDFPGSKKLSDNEIRDMKYWFDE